MADIQSSLRRLQESIRGLSDASALVGAVDLAHSSGEANEILDGIGIDIGISTNRSRSRSRSSATSRASFQHRHPSPHQDRHHDRGRHNDEEDGRSSRSSNGLAGVPAREEQSVLSSIPRESRDSAEVSSPLRQQPRHYSRSCFLCGCAWLEQLLALQVAMR